MVSDDAPAFPRWQSPELAWPLALFAGFAGTALGGAVGLPFLPALLAAAGTGALVLPQLAAARTNVAFVTGTGHLLGVAAATLALALERGPERTAGAFPWSFDGLVLPFVWMCALAMAAGLARPSRGLLPLLVLTLATGAASAGAGSLAVELTTQRLGDAAAAASAFGPGLFLPLLGGWALAAGLGAPDLRETRVLQGLGALGIGVGLSETLVRALDGPWRDLLATL